MEYSAGMVSCLFWLSETRITAELLVNGLAKEQIKELVIKDNLYQVRGADRARDIFGAVLRRLESLPHQLVHQISKADIGTAKLLVLLSIMKTDLLFYEFVHQVHRQAILLGEQKNTDRAIHTFFANKREQSEVVGRWSENTITRLKQCYNKILFEAGVLSHTKGERHIIIPPVDYQIQRLLEENHLQMYLNAITGEV